MHDWRGKYVKPGSLILYSTRFSSSMSQNIARVDEVVAVQEGFMKVEKAKATVIDSSDSFTKVPRKVTVTVANLTVIGD